MNPDLLAEVAATADAAVEALVADLVAGETTEAEFVALATAALERAEAESTALADLGVAAAVGAGALGLLPERSGAARLAATTIAREARGVAYTFQTSGREERVRWRAEIEARLKTPGLDREEYVEMNRTLRMLDRQGIESRAVVLDAGQDANRRAIRGHDSRWTRATNGGACEVCRDLADGTVLSASTTMHTHKGCACTQKPVATPAT